MSGSDLPLMKNQSASGAEENSVEEGFVAIGNDLDTVTEGRSVLRLSVGGYCQAPSKQTLNQASRIACVRDSTTRALCRSCERKDGRGCMKPYGSKRGGTTGVLAKFQLADGTPAVVG